MLHVHSGDCAASVLAAAGVSGTHTVWTELLMQGPLRPSLGLAAFRAERAAVLSASTGGARSPAECLARLGRQDEALAGWREHDETVLWVDACLYDQAILVRLLAWFAEVPEAWPRLRLICVGSHADVPEFHGLGQLSGTQMAALLPTREAVTGAQFELARQAWQALCSTTPQAMEELARQPTPALPYLQAALRRWLEQFPSTRNGLCRLQQEVLEALPESGSSSPPAILAAVSARERPAFFGDTLLWQCINGMAFCRTPLLRLDDGVPLPLWDTHGIGQRRVASTPAGRAVAAAAADALAANGSARWIGGVDLGGDLDAPWRWDPTAACIRPGQTTTERCERRE